MRKELIILYALSLTFFISITVFEAFVIISLLILSYDIFTKKSKLSFGKLGFFLTIFVLSSLVSSFLFYPKVYNHIIEENVFLLTYFLKDYLDKDSIKSFSYNISKAWFFIGLALSAVGLYNLFTKKYEMLFFGGSFDSGFIFTVFFASSLSLFFYSKKPFYLIGSFLFFIMVILSTKRSDILGLFGVILVFLIVLVNSKLLDKKKVLITFLALFVISIFPSYVVFHKDKRFLDIAYLLEGKDIHRALERVSSERLRYLNIGLSIIERDIKEKNVLPLLIGHGIRSGVILTNKVHLERFESIFLVSEFIERGAIGVLMELIMYFIILKALLKTIIKKKEDIFVFNNANIFTAQILGSIFTFFWSAYLPLLFLMFGIFEKYFDEL